MGKSIRSKAKMASRARKRLQSHYAITDAARTQRLSDKLLGKDKVETKEGGDGGMVVEGEGEKVEVEVDENMEGEPKKISTAGPKGSRRESWRASKGMKPHNRRGPGGNGNGKAKKNSRRR